MRNLKKVLSVLLVVVMLATAMVPAFAADTYTYSAQAKTLYDLGLFKGLSPTEYVPDLGTALTREQGFALIVRLLGNDDDAAALKAADVDAALAPFGDVKDVEPTLKNTIAYAVKNGLVIGDTSKLLNAKGPMLGKDFATVLLRKLGYADTEFTYDTATVDLANKGGLDATVAAKLASKALIRDDAAGMMFAALQAKYKTGETVIAKLVASKDVDEAKAVAANVYTKPVAAAVTATVTGAKKFTLTFNTAIDTTKVTASSISVKKGASTYGVDSFVVASDKKSAVVTISNPITNSDYEISVTGLADTAVTAKVTGVAEKVAKIEFLSDSAVIKAGTSNNTISVPYRILNQFGEDVTSKKWTSVTFEASKGDKAPYDGRLELNYTTSPFFYVGEKVSVTATYIDTDNNTSVFNSALLTVSQIAQVSELNVTGLYNDNKDAVLDVNATSFADFKILIDAKDANGKSILASDLTEALVVQSSNPTVVKYAEKVITPASGTPYNVPDFREITVNGEKKIALNLANGSDTPQKAGTASIIFVSKATGKMSQLNVEVKDAQKIDTLALQVPDYAVAGEEIKIPVTAVDINGKEITNIDSLRRGSTTLTASSGTLLNGGRLAFNTDSATGKPYLSLTGVTTKGTVYISGSTATYKPVNFSLSVQDTAKLDSVSGMKSSIKTNFFLNGSSTDFSYGNVAVKDQYGRDVTKDQLLTKYALGAAYRFTVETSDNLKVRIAGTETAPGSGLYIIDNTLTPTVYGDAKGSSSITVKLQKYNATTHNWDVVSTAPTFTSAVVDMKDIQSFTVSTVASVYTDKSEYKSNSHAANIEVNGLLANGAKVLIPRYTISDNYKVNTTGALGYDPNGTVTGRVYATNATLPDDSDSDLTATYTVNIFGYNKMETISNTTKVSGVSTAVDKIALFSTSDIIDKVVATTAVALQTAYPATTPTYASALYGSYVKVSDTVVEVSNTVVNSESTAIDFAKNVVKVTDQYGKTPVDARFISSVTVSTDNSTVPYSVGSKVFVNVVTTNGKTLQFTINIK